MVKPLEASRAPAKGVQSRPDPRTEAMLGVLLGRSRHSELEKPVHYFLLATELFDRNVSLQ